MSTRPQSTIETFPNPSPERDYTIRMTIPEFTCLCPKTAQPDFATLKLEYVPESTCIELKALKLYIWSFRDRGCFHEAVTNEILGTLGDAVSPRFMRLTAGVLCARRHLHDGGRRTPGPRLAARPGRFAALIAHFPASRRRSASPSGGAVQASPRLYNPASFVKG